MLSSWSTRLAFACLVCVSLSSCSLFKTTCEEDDRECIGPGPGLGAGLGERCSITADCKENLVCNDSGKCVATGGVASCENRDGEACTEAPATMCDTDATRTNSGDDGNEQILCKEACFEACEKCRLTVDCSMVDYCGSRRVCLLAGNGPAGAACDDTGDCRRGLVCELPDLTSQGTLSLNDLATLTGTCKQGGTGEQGDPCEVISDCLAGLFCAEVDIGETKKVCTNLPTPIPTNYSAELPPLPDTWGGVQCEEPDADAPRIARFQVPRASVDVGEDFFSLPFPNDIRRKADGKIDLGGFPVPPEELGVPFINRYAEVAQEDLEGFSTNAVAVLRFSHPYDFATTGAEAGKPATVRLVDLTPGDEFGMERGIAWKETSGTLSAYVCPHWLGISRPLGNPLTAGHTYAAIVTTGVKMKETGDDFERDDDFVAMLGSSKPSDSVLADAWDAYKPLRDWIDMANEDASKILNAAVFTTQDPEAVIAGLRERVVADGPAMLTDVTNCSEASAVSPCETQEKDGPRGKCANPGGSDFTEIHAKIRLPIFQHGTAPYLDPEDGGGFELDAQGLPTIDHHEGVCMAISVPTKAPPPGGYPVLIYSHGTGGSFTNTMGNNDFARDLAKADVPIAVVAIDMPEHGSRRGTGEGSDQEPDGLFYNFLNPRAARDNVAQGSADLFSLVQWVVASGGFSAADSPTGSAVPFDVSKIAMMGHSQGATHTALMISHEPSAIAVVLSGVGGHLTSSLLTKTSPVDIAAIVPIGLQDPDNSFRLAAGIFNPALSVIQSVFDSVDPINYARHLRLRRLPETEGGQSVFVTYGVGDTFAPEKTQLAYLVAGQLPFVTPILSEPSDISDFDNTMVQLLAPPLTGNDNFGEGPRTIGTRQYIPGEDSEGVQRDGHFVATGKGEAGRADVTRFLEQVLAGQTPQIGAP